MLPQIYPGNYQASIKDFFNRGGFVTGLNPTMIGNIWYANGEGATYTGSNGHVGRSPRDGFATITYALAKMSSYDILVIDGVFREQAVTPQDVFDGMIIGAGNQPRQATDGGVATGGGASWLSPSSPTAMTPLLKVRESGWTFANFQMAPVAASACVRLSRAETASDMDGGHAQFLGMYMVGGGANGIGIEDVGGCGYVTILNSRFQALGDTAIKGISTGIAVPLSWKIGEVGAGNRFQQNLNDIKMSLSYGIIKGNELLTAGSGSTNKVISTTFVSTQGGNNQVHLNFFNNTEAQIAPSSGYTGASSDFWMNYVNDQADLAFGQPA